MEKFRETCQFLQSEKDALVLLVNIIEGEKRDLEKQVAEIEQKENAANKRVKELEVQNNFLNEKLQAAKEKQLDIAPFCNQASSLQKEINQIFLRLAGEMYRIKKNEARLE